MNRSSWTGQDDSELYRNGMNSKTEKSRERRMHAAKSMILLPTSPESASDGSPRAPSRHSVAPSQSRMSSSVTTPENLVSHTSSPRSGMDDRDTKKISDAGMGMRTSLSKTNGLDYSSSRLPDEKISEAPKEKALERNFRKYFPNLTEKVIQYFHCAYSGDILFQGVLFITQTTFCFYSKVLSKKSIQIDVNTITDIAKSKTAKLIPNAVRITTEQGKTYVFCSLLSRSSTFSVLMNVWKKNQEIEHATNSTGSMNDDQNLSGSGDNSDISSSEDSPEIQSNSPMLPSTLTTDGYNSQKNEAPSVERKAKFNDKSHQGTVNNISSIPDHNQVTAKFSRPKMFLASSSLLVLFLFGSSLLLAYKIVHIQAQLDSRILLRNAKEFSNIDQGQKIDPEVYNLRNEQQIANVKRLHSILEANLQLLDKVNQSLKGLRDLASKCPDGATSAEMNA